jgi:outer membrane protein OmpU
MTVIVAENDTYGLKYTMGNVTAAYQITKVNYDATGTADQDAQHYGISLAVNENLSVSAGRQVVEIDNAVDDEINTGIQASYTMGSISIGGAFNTVDSAGGAAGTDVEATLLNVSFAF